MSSPKYEPPSYEIPAKPSKQLAVVLDYFNCFKNWDLKTLGQSSTPDFTQPEVTRVSGHTGPGPEQERRYRIPSSQIPGFAQGRSPRCVSTDGHSSLVPMKLIDACSKIRIYDVNESKGKIWVHVRTIQGTIP
jgi:hypothetical protein